MAKLIACNNGESNLICSAAQDFCNGKILYALPGIWDLYYVPTANPDPYPPALQPYLQNPAVTSKIGSQPTVTWNDYNVGVSSNFHATGDWMRSSLSDLEMAINSGVHTVIYDGDADYICNYMGVEAMVRASSYSFQPFH